MTRDEVIDAIRAAMGNIDLDQIRWDHDPATGGDVVRVLLRPSQLESALREDGRHVREMAMRTGVDIDVGLPTHSP